MKIDINKLNDKFELLHGAVINMAKMQKINRDKINDLEAKNALLRIELDSVYDVLNMDASDIKALQDEIFEGYTRKQTGE